MGVAFTIDPQRIYDVSLPESIDAKQLAEMAEFLNSMVPEVEEEWEELPPRVQDALTELARRDDLDTTNWQPVEDLPGADKRAVNVFLGAVNRIREATLDAIERDKSRGPFREYTDEEIREWGEADKLPPDLAEWVKSTLR